MAQGWSRGNQFANKKINNTVIFYSLPVTPPYINQESFGIFLVFSLYLGKVIFKV